MAEPYVFIMKRKVIKQGNGTLTITLPKEWTEEVGITGKSEVDIENLGNELLIRSSDSKTGKRINVVLESNNKDYTLQILRNVYLSGYDEAYIQYYDDKSIGLVRKAIDDMIGYQIFEQNNKGCLIKNISEVINEEFSVLLRKVFLLKKNMFEILLEDVKANDLRNLEHLKDIVKTMHRFGDYCRRTIIKKHIFNNYESTRLYLIITRLLICAHSIKYIYEQLIEIKNLHLSKECINFMEDTYNYYILFYNLYYDRKIKDIYKISVIRQDMLNDRLPKIMKGNKGENIVYLYTAQIIREISANGGILFTLKEEKEHNALNSLS